MRGIVTATDFNSLKKRASEAVDSWDVRSIQPDQLATSLVCVGLTTLGFAVGSKRLLLALPAAATIAAGIAIRVHAQDEEEQPREHVVGRATEQAEFGRRLAIYDQETGLLAYWFAALRADEECAQAARYGEPLTLVAAQCSIESHNDIEVAGHRFRMALRAVDIVSYVGSARFIAILPSTSIENVTSVSARLRDAGFNHVGAAAFGEDGRTFDELYGEAIARLAPVEDEPESSADSKIAA